MVAAVAERYLAEQRQGQSAMPDFSRDLWTAGVRRLLHRPVGGRHGDEPPWLAAIAGAYMREHTLESDLQIDSETFRYSIRSPAQALAYRMGREAMVGFRAKAERALGARFDLATFHDVVLDTGSLPLFLLEREIDRWIARGGTR